MHELTNPYLLNGSSTTDAYAIPLHQIPRFHRHLMTPHTTGDTHIYVNHFEQVATQLSREPRALPKMKINPEVKSIFDFKYEDFELVDYDPYPRIPAPVAV